ncbi:hypothetical protein CTheo_9028 [Ceratobasidium theobromae]|uniref:Uncharacterized protein n=1 Tax=Ceratobasidium theobromae TaxID=1582974 RepID=A0A5N5Q753_9AGAM|nr:hypothetical protein CTheo_9028 [Ceratobasidium theobromae]
MVATRRSGVTKSIPTKSPSKRSSKRATVASNEESTLRAQLAEREQALASQEQRINELAGELNMVTPYFC